MKKRYTKLLMLIPGLLLYHQQLSAQGLQAMGGTQIVMNGAPTLVIQNGSLDLTSSTIIPASGTLLFAGNSTAFLSGAAIIPLYNLSIDKAGGTLVLGGQVSINNAVTFLNGKIDLNGSIINLGSTGMLMGENAASYVSDPVGNGKILVTADLNNPLAANPGNLGVSITSSANLGNTLVSRGNMPQSGSGLTGIKRFYDISPANNSGLNATVTFNYLDGELNGTVESDLVMLSSSDGGTTFNELATASFDESANLLTVNGLNSLNRLTLGNTFIPLPVELISFNGRLENGTTFLNWSTANEADISSYDVERSEDGANFQPIGSVAAQGAASATYNYQDNQPFSGITYYRLKLNSSLHQSTYSRIIQVHSNEINDLVLVYPNPVSTEVYVEFTSLVAQTMHLQINDAGGKVVADREVSVSAGRNKAVWNIATLAAGTYYLSAGTFAPVKFNKF